jgi:hypothetical protein
VPGPLGGSHQPAPRQPRGPIGRLPPGSIVLAQAGGALPAIVKLTEPNYVPGSTGPGFDLPAKPLLPPFKAKQLSPTEIEQGSLADCVLPAVLAAMAHTSTGRTQLRKMVKMQSGVVVQSTWSRGKITSKGLVTVAFPTAKVPVQISRLLYRQGNTVLYARSSQKTGWVSFIEKAYAVRKGGYSGLRHIAPLMVMKDLLGKTPSFIQLRKNEGGPLLLKNLTLLKKMLTEATAYPTIATTPKGSGFNTPNGAAYGLAANHGSAVLGMGTITEKRPGKRPRKVTVVKLSDEGSVVPFPFALFLKDFDYVVSVRP